TKDGAIVLHGGASEAEGMPPYLPFLEAFGRHIQVTPLDQLRTQVAAAPQVLATLLPELITRLGDLPASPPLPPEQARFRLYEAIGAFLEVIGEHMRWSSYSTTCSGRTLRAWTFCVTLHATSRTLSCTC